MAARSENARKRNIYQGALVGACALALAIPVAAGTASANPANPAVVVRGTASCAAAGAGFVPIEVSIDAGAAGSQSVAVNAATPSARYLPMTFNPVTEVTGNSATITVLCENPATGDQASRPVNFTVKRPAGTSVVQVQNVS